MDRAPRGSVRAGRSGGGGGGGGGGRRGRVPPLDRAGVRDGRHLRRARGRDDAPLGSAGAGVAARVRPAAPARTRRLPYHDRTGDSAPVERRGRVAARPSAVRRALHRRPTGGDRYAVPVMGRAARPGAGGGPGAAGAGGPPRPPPPGPRPAPPGPAAAWPAPPPPNPPAPR